MGLGKFLQLTAELKRRYWLNKMIKDAENPFFQTKNPFKQSYQGPLAKSDFVGFTQQGKYRRNKKNVKLRKELDREVNN